MEALNDLLLKKIQRQTLLKDKSKQLENLDLDLSSSKFGRWFGSSYLRFKRFLIFVIAIGLILLSLFLLLAPRVLFEDQEFKTTVMENSREHYAKVFGQAVVETVFEFSEGGSELQPNEFMNILAKSLDKVIEKQMIKRSRDLGVLLLFLTVILLYIARLTKKMRVRNTKISENQAITQEVILMFREAIEEEEQELVWMQEIMQKRSTPDSNQPPPIPPKG